MSCHSEHVLVRVGSLYHSAITFLAYLVELKLIQVKFCLSEKQLILKFREVSHLKTTVVEGGEDSDSGVDVFQLSQEGSVKVRVHVAVDPGEF